MGILFSRVKFVQWQVVSCDSYRAWGLIHRARRADACVVGPCLREPGFIHPEVGIFYSCAGADAGERSFSGVLVMICNMFFAAAIGKCGVGF